eukprot:COSAG02_NODE_8801_length_2439_cov_1.840171_1_plen_131_part_00
MTDRILMRAMPGRETTLTGYDSAWKVTSSDHDPVYATYEFNAPERPLTGNYRRFVLEIGMMEVSELTVPGPQGCRWMALISMQGVRQRTCESTSRESTCSCPPETRTNTCPLRLPLNHVLYDRRSSNLCA